MPKHDISHPSPLTLQLLVDLNEMLVRLNMTNEQFRVELNKFLPRKRQITGTHAGASKLNRWLNPTSRNWSEPQSEIALAFQKFLQSKIKRKKG